MNVSKLIIISICFSFVFGYGNRTIGEKVRSQKTQRLALRATDIVIASPIEIADDSIAGKWKISNILKGNSFAVGQESKIKPESKYRLSGGLAKTKVIPVEGIFFFVPQHPNKPKSSLQIVYSGVRLKDGDGKFYLPFKQTFPGDFQFIQPLPRNRRFTDWEKSWDHSLKIVEDTLNARNEFETALTNKTASIRVRNALHWIDTGLHERKYLPEMPLKSRMKLYEKAVDVVNRDGAFDDRLKLLQSLQKLGKNRSFSFAAEFETQSDRTKLLERIADSNIRSDQKAVYLQHLARGLPAKIEIPAEQRFTVSEQQRLIIAVLPLLNSKHMNVQKFAANCAGKSGLLFDNSYDTDERKKLYLRLRQMYLAPNMGVNHSQIAQALYSMSDKQTWRKLSGNPNQTLVLLQYVGGNRDHLFFAVTYRDNPVHLQLYNLKIALVRLADDGKSVLEKRMVVPKVDNAGLSIPLSLVVTGNWQFQVFASQKKGTDKWNSELCFLKLTPEMYRILRW